eukprot:10285-Heterococcus_DN1.PRE.1
MDTDLVVLLPLDQYRLLLLGSQTDCESQAAAVVHTCTASTTASIAQHERSVHKRSCSMLQHACALARLECKCALNASSHHKSAVLTASRGMNIAILTFFASVLISLPSTVALYSTL